MTRPTFLQTLAALLAGTHAAGPVALPGVPDAVRRRLPRLPDARSARCSGAPTPAACR